MTDHTQQPPSKQFLLVEDAARALSLSNKVIRQGIACGLIPIRRDNTGTIRVHLDEIPDALEEKTASAEVHNDLHAAVLADEVISLEKSAAETDAQRVRLEALVEKQGATLNRLAALLDMSQGDADAPNQALAAVREQLSARDAEVIRLSNLLERTFQAIDARDRQVDKQTVQLSGTTDKAMNLLTRAIREGELSSQQLQLIHQQMSASANTNSKLERELDQRNSVINEQNSLIERMVALAEHSASVPSSAKPRRRTLWQRLWGSGKGI